MKSKTKTAYRTILDFLLLPALWLCRRRQSALPKTFKVKRPAGSVAPLY
jgi:hypothetical protein